VIGTAFYVMEFLDGRFITDPLMPGVNPGERREMYAYVFCLTFFWSMMDEADSGIGGAPRSKRSSNCTHWTIHPSASPG
jgi:aminoglycoside phosphotransferase (APT) family kinase protein